MSKNAPAEVITAISYRTCIAHWLPFWSADISQFGPHFAKPTSVEDLKKSEEFGVATGYEVIISYKEPSKRDEIRKLVKKVGKAHPTEFTNQMVDCCVPIDSEFISID